MKFALPLLLLAPVAMAHEGHGGVGPLHHFVNALPVLALVVVVGVVWWMKGRK